MKLVLIEWVDSAMEYGWQGKALFDATVSKCQTAGFMLNETDEVMVVAQSRSNSGRWADAITIPKCSIKRIRKLRIG